MSNLETAPSRTRLQRNRVRGTSKYCTRAKFRWAARGHSGPAHAAATAAVTDRCVVLYRSLRARLAARMDVPPHPHTGLQTVSWLFSGEVRAPRQCGRTRHGPPRRAQPDDRGRGDMPLRSRRSSRLPYCMACSCGSRLPESDRGTGRDFAHYVPSPISLPGAVARVFLGSWPAAGRRCTRSPRCWAPSLTWTAGPPCELDVDPTFEHGVLCDLGTVEMGGTPGRRRSWVPRRRAVRTSPAEDGGSAGRGYCCWAELRSPKRW